MTEQSQTPTPPPRFIGLIIGILRRPRATLERLAELPRRPWRRIALLVLVAVILPVVPTYTVSSRQAAAQFQAALSSEQPGRVSAVPVAPGKGGVVQVAPGRPGMEETQPMPAPTLSPLAGLALPALGRLGGLVLNWLLWSGVLYVVGTMMGGRNTFGHMFQMVVWTWVPFAVRGVLQAGYIWLAGQPIANPGLSGFVTSQASTSGMPAPAGMGTLIWQSLLGRVDIYLFWHLALVVVGLMAVARLSRRKALTLALGSWVLLTLASLIPAIVQASFAGMRLG